MKTTRPRLAYLVGIVATAVAMFCISWSMDSAPTRHTRSKMHLPEVHGTTAVAQVAIAVAAYHVLMAVAVAVFGSTLDTNYWVPKAIVAVALVTVAVAATPARWFATNGTISCSRA